MEESKNLKLARQARADNNSEDAKMFYNKVREEDPENGEAKFFYAFYSIYEGKNIEIPNRFSNLCKTLPSSINFIKESSLSKEEQLTSIEEIVNAFVPETWAENRYMNIMVADFRFVIFIVHISVFCPRFRYKSINDFFNTC